MSETIYYMDTNEGNDIPIPASTLVSEKTLVVPSEAFDPALISVLTDTASSLVTGDNYGKGCGYFAFDRETYPHAFWTNALAHIEEYGLIKFESDSTIFKIIRKRTNMFMDVYFIPITFDSNITFRVWNDLDAPEDTRSIYVAAIFERIKSVMPD